jgi:hypothetical protein
MHVAVHLKMREPKSLKGLGEPSPTWPDSYFRARVRSGRPREQSRFGTRRLSGKVFPLRDAAALRVTLASLCLLGGLNNRARMSPLIADALIPTTGQPGTRVLIERGDGRALGVSIFQSFGRRSKNQDAVWFRQDRPRPGRD